MQTLAKNVLKNLLDEVETMETEMFPPNATKSKGEKELGTVTDITLRKLYSLGQLYRRDEQMAKAEMRFISADSLRDETLNKARRAEERADTLLALFWYLVQELHNCYGVTIGIRKNWALVQAKPQNHPLIEFLTGQNEQE